MTTRTESPRASNPARLPTQHRRRWLASSSLVSAAIISSGLALAPISAARAEGLPMGGTIATGSASINVSGNTATITQSSERAVINWDSFSVANGNSAVFLQPNANSATLNRVTGSATSSIAGSIVANGTVYLVNPNGIAITSTGSVQTGGSFVASTLDITDADFMAGNARFAGSGASRAVQNAGKIVAGQGAYVALLGGAVGNSGSITVPLGTLAMGSGEQIALDLNGANFLQVAVPTALVMEAGALVDNSGTITVSGGAVQLKAAVLKDAVRNIINMSGTINADSAVGDGGRILLIGGSDTKSMAGSVKVSGTLSARATGASGNGGFVETSGAKVDLDGVSVSTLAANGAAGTWLIDPNDFTVAASGGDISGAQLSANLANGNVRILSSQGTAGSNGDINVNDAVSWNTNTLTLDAFRDINVNAVMRASGTAGFVGIVGDTAQNGTGTASGKLDFGVNLLGFYGRLDLAPTASFNLNGTAYTIITALGAEGSVTGTDLQGINGGPSTLSRGLTGNYVLGADIDASATSGWNGGEGFRPIGTAPGSVEQQFDGQFIGLGHTINNLTLNYANRGNLGLFGVIGTSGSVSNVGIRGGTVSGVIGFVGVGGLAGTNSGEVRNAFATADVTGDFSVGGLVGRNRSGASIRNAFATGNVSAIRFGGGGLVGENVGLIENAFATGTVSGEAASGLGGLVGSLLADSVQQGTLRTVFATGNVSGVRSIGGLVGEARGSTERPTLITDAFASGDVSASSTFFQGGAGGLVGTGLGLNITRAYATGRVAGSDTVIAGLVGYADHNQRVNVVAGFWDQEQSGQSRACGNSDCLGSVTALNTGQTRQAASFVGFTVDAVGGAGTTWRIYEGRTTPLLAPLLTPVIVSMPSSSVTAVYTGQDLTNVAGVTTRLAANGNAADPSRIFGTTSNSCSAGAGACVNAGTYTVTGSADLFSDAVGYDLIFRNPLSTSLTITPAPVSVTYSAVAASGVYGTAPGTLTGTVAATGLLNSDTLATTTQGTAIWNTAATSASGVGNYAINGSGLTGSNGNYAFTFVQAAGNAGAYSVTARPILVTALDASSIYGSTLPTFTFNVGGLGLVNGDVLTGALASAGTSTSNVGNYAITQGSLANPNYRITFAGANHSITPAALTITGNTQSQIYSSLAQTNGFAAAGLVGADQVTGVTGLATGTNVGVFNDNLSAATGTGLSNYTITYVNGALRITPAALTITGNEDSRIYSGLGQTNGFAVTGLLGSDTVAGVSGLATGTNAGTYIDALSNATGTGLTNYVITYVNRGLTITPAPLTVTYSADAASGIYGNAIGALSGTTSAVGLVNGETLAAVLRGDAVWTTNATAASGVGAYAVSGSGLAGNNANYTVSFVQAAGNAAALTITPRPISVTANAVSYVYGATVPALTFAVGGLGLVNGDTLTGALATTATSRSAVGSYAINRGTLANANYTITYNGANLSVTPAALRITGNTTSVNFNGAPQINGFTSAGLIGDDTVTSVSGRATGTLVGSYIDALSAAAGTGLSNYTITYVNGSLTIKALPVDAALVPFLPFADESGNGPETDANGSKLSNTATCPTVTVSSTLRDKGQANLGCAL